MTEIRNHPDPSINWIRDLPAQSGQQILRRLDQAFVNMANPDHPAGSPAFKRRGDRMGIPFTGQAVQFRKPNRLGGGPLPGSGLAEDPAFPDAGRNHSQRHDRP
ncbi:hypothetical protein [Streptomyces sp. NPDC002845]